MKSLQFYCLEGTENKKKFSVNLIRLKNILFPAE